MSGQSASDELWAAVDRLVESAPTESDLRSHRLELFAARRWRQLGRAVPADIAQLERTATVVGLAVPTLLARVREAHSGPLILHKGPEVAACYPDPALRLYGDIDLLVPDAEEVQQALVRAGFELTGDPKLYIGIHHLRPLQWRDLPVVVEIHARPKWVGSLPTPTVAQLLEAAVPSSVAEGYLSLPAAEHALLLAAHSWAHEPLRRLRDLVDVAAVANGADASRVATVAEQWGASRLWSSTKDAVDFAFGTGAKPFSLRTWARNLSQVRERTVLEHHLQRWLSDFWVLPPARAVATLPRTFVSEVSPEPDETWRTKVARTSRALRNATRRRSEHQDELARETQRR